MKLSIVTTLYKSSPFIDEFYTRITKEAQKITDDYEIIFVDDGSPDDSLEKALSLYKKDKKIKILELSRNFGHHRAAITGLTYATGDYVFLIDIDLEEEPELIKVFWNEINSNSNLDSVYGVQENRTGRWFEKFSGNTFWKLFNYLSDTYVEPNQTTVRIMKKNIIDSLKLLNEKELFLAANLQYLGYHQKSITLQKSKKPTSTYTFKRKIELLVNAVTSFSSKPLHFIFGMGSFITLLSTLYIIFLLVKKFFYGELLNGWVSLIISIWFLGGVIIFSIGLIGIYLSKIFIEVKDRPKVIIRNIYKELE